MSFGALCSIQLTMRTSLCFLTVFCVVLQLGASAATTTSHRVLKSKKTKASNETLVNGIGDRALTDCFLFAGGALAEGMLAAGVVSRCIYGKYCGRGCTDPNWGPPVDSVDNCCRQHDYATTSPGITACAPNQQLSACLRDRMAYRVQEKLSPTAVNQALAIKTVIDLFLKCYYSNGSCPLPSPTPGPRPTPSPSPKPTVSFPSGTYRLLNGGGNALSYYTNIYNVYNQPVGKGGQTFQFQKAPAWQGYTNVYYISTVVRPGYFLANDDCYDLDLNHDYEPDGISCGPVSVQEAVPAGLTQVWILEGSYPNFVLKHPNEILSRQPPYLLTGPPNTRPRFSSSGTKFTLQQV
jgi:hypothetical protein